MGVQRSRYVTQLRFDSQLFLMAVCHDGNNARRVDIQSHRLKHVLALVSQPPKASTYRIKALR